MKLRIRENTIRLRLKRAEVDQLASGKSIVEQTCFPDSVLTYRLDVSSDGNFSASFRDGDLTISLPEAEVTQWAQNDQVSIVAEQEERGWVSDAEGILPGKAARLVSELSRLKASLSWPLARARLRFTNILKMFSLIRMPIDSGPYPN